ncbi:hypothetical protein RO3G_13771 [Rhizopus delemar RA 99-880]|uniref:Uncharacterized protein n=1 Tax=Rhizopus delemar (strain RA 99-880 / ATCC MYA-4621 / FGSC 9543 / NRRL 43880) TaxID=246409 RepID=I1CKT0_RHIO9|nr:hypothetical protein RO3G_13771 [Rhizopus delemar RA 99-880]|eukprot:EIE89060.1 hypothetical protein RO3G_13771 [Rhizopus delemar RA 99-880]
MLKNIRVQNAPVVIVCLTYAGFTTDLNILKEFIRERILIKAQYLSALKQSLLV